MSLWWEEIADSKELIHNRFRSLWRFIISLSSAQPGTFLSCCKLHTPLQNYNKLTLTPAQIDSYTWEANGWEQGMYSLKIQWASEQWNLPEKLEKHLWLDKIGESQTYHFLTFSFGGWWIAISHQVLLYSHASWRHQINMKFSRALFDPEGHSAISPWFSIKKWSGAREGGRRREKERERIFCSFSHCVSRDDLFASILCS